MSGERPTLFRLLIALALLIPAASAQPAADHVPARVLVKFKAGVSDAQVTAAFASRSARSMKKLDRIGVHLVQLLSAGDEQAAVQAFRAHPDIEFAELDQIVPPADLTPNDPIYPLWQTYFPQIHAPAAWSMTAGSASVVIAIIDSGVYGAHEDLASKMVAGWNLYDGNSDTTDVYGHGTQVAGAAAAASNNGVGVASVCWYCMIMPVRVTDTTGSATYSSIAAGIEWAADHGARIANASFIVTDSASVTAAAQYMQSKGGVVTVSSGNYGVFDAAADNPYILTIGAIDPSNNLESWSNTGNNLDLVAPGCVFTTVNGGGYSNGCGTSLSAPVVAGVAGLMLSMNPALTPSQITSYLQQSADDLGAAGWDSSFGWGRVNVANAVSKAGGGTTDTTAPTVSITSPSASATVSATITIQASAADNVGVKSVSFYVDNTLVATDAAAPYSLNWNTTTVANGLHSIKATAADAAGNTASSSVSVTVSNATPDTTPPTVSIASPSPSATVAGMVTIQVSASDNVGVASVAFYVDGSQVGSLTSAPYSLSWNSLSVSSASHTVMAVATDAAGNRASSSVGINVTNSVADTTPPTVSVVSPAQGSTVSRTTTIQVSASDNVGVASVTFYVDSVQIGRLTAAPYNLSWNTGTVANGSHTIKATAADAAGNVSSASVSVTVGSLAPPSDTVPPSITITSPSQGAAVSGTLNVTVNASDNVGVVRVDLLVDGAVLSSSSSAPFTIKWNAKQASRGTHTLQARAHDAAGNVGMSQVVTVTR